MRLDILVNHEAMDALSTIIHRTEAQRHGSSVTRRMKEIIPRAQFEIPIQASIGSKSSGVKRFLRCVRTLRLLYGGDRTQR